MGIGRRKRVMLSGGFDPLHVGHLRMINAAFEHGDVIIALNSDEWLERKKGYVFMPWGDRSEILLGLENVQQVVHVDDADGTVCEAIKRVSPDVFANGGDRKSDNVPEIQVCQELGVELLFGVGGDKVRSSSELVENSKQGEGSGQ